MTRIPLLLILGTLTMATVSCEKKVAGPMEVPGEEPASPVPDPGDEPASPVPDPGDEPASPVPDPGDENTGDTGSSPQY